MRLQLGNLAYTPQISNLFRLTSWALDCVTIMAFTIAPLRMDMTHTYKAQAFLRNMTFLVFILKRRRSHATKTRCHFLKRRDLMDLVMIYKSQGRATGLSLFTCNE